MDLTTKQMFFLFFAIHLPPVLLFTPFTVTWCVNSNPPVEEGEFLLYIMLKCFNASTIALYLSSGHCDCISLCRCYIHIIKFNCDINVIIWLLFQLGQKNNCLHMDCISKLVNRLYFHNLISTLR